MTAIDQTKDTVVHTLSADWAGGAAITVSYPAGRGPADYGGADGHQITSQNVATLEKRTGTAVFTFGASNISIVNGTGRTITGGQAIFVELDRAGVNLTGDIAASSKMTEARTFWVNLGAPIAASDNSAVLSQACTLATGLATGINGSLAASGVATFATPRNVVAAWTGTAVLTVTGTDEYGAVVRESSASGTSLAGKKAFKTITSVTTSADITGLTVGHGDVLGLPVFLESVVDVLKEYQDGAAPTAGTVVAGVAATATATTGDVRGTYDPNAACDGSKKFALLVAVKSAAYKGAAQYAG